MPAAPVASPQTGNAVMESATPGHKPDGKGQAVDGAPFNEHDFLQHVVSISFVSGLPFFSRV